MLQLPLVIDNTAPQLVSAVYDDKKKTVTVTMRDNHYLDFIYWYTNDDDTDFIGITDEDITADGSVKKTIDVSGFDEPEKLTIGVCDYAMNYAEESLAMLSGNIGVEAVSLNAENETTVAKSRVKNNTNADINADIIIAFYDENLKLIATAVEEDRSVKSGEDIPVSYTISEDIQSASTVKMFVWEHNSLNPIDTAKSFGLL